MKNLLFVALLSLSSVTYAGVSIYPVIDHDAGKYGASVKLQHGWLYGKAKGYRKLGGGYSGGLTAGIKFRF